MDEIVIDGVIGSWEVDAKEIIYQISRASGDLLVKLNSPGGSVIDGISIFNALQKYDNGKVIVEIGAAAASIASYIALAGDVVQAHSNSIYMIHLAWLPVVGNYIELRKAADISEGLSSMMANVYAAKTKMEKSDAISLMEKETYYFGQEILDAGFADELIAVESDIGKSEAYSMTVESLKACNNALYEHRDEMSTEAVAKLLPKKVQTHKKAADFSAQQRRAREIQIKEKETLCQ